MIRCVGSDKGGGGGGGVPPHTHSTEAGFCGDPDRPSFPCVISPNSQKHTVVLMPPIVRASLHDMKLCVVYGGRTQLQLV